MERRKSKEQSAALTIMLAYHIWLSARVHGETEIGPAIMREYRRNNPEPRLLMEASYRAKKRGLDFNLSLDDIIIPSVCPVFGLPFVQARGGGPGDQSATLDRVDSTKGYVKGNVWVISGKANRFKNNATLAELKQLVAALEERLNT